MILLSALLASLTGFVAGERPVAPAQVELSAAAVAVEALETVASPSEQSRQLVVAPPRLQQGPVVAVGASAPIVTGRAHLNIKQSWLI